MDLDRIDQIARDTMLDRSEHASREPGWLYFHGRRTGRIALWLAEEVEGHVNGDVLYLGALFHDVGKGQEPHNEIGAQRTRALLEPLCTAAELTEICELVRQHNLRHDPQRRTAVKLVQDADVLDHVGPIGPWLAFYWSGAKGETVEENKAFIYSNENRRYREKLRAMLNFERSRIEFDLRVEFEDEFFGLFHQVYAEGVRRAR